LASTISVLAWSWAKERQKSPGSLRTLGHIVILQRCAQVGIAVVAVGVEVAVKSRAAGGQILAAQHCHQAGEQGLVGFAAYPVGVGAKVGGLGQRGESERQRQSGVRR
jgi:hypothetical protein